MRTAVLSDRFVEHLWLLQVAEMAAVGQEDER
jgi:hypothetical protein